MKARSAVDPSDLKDMQALIGSSFGSLRHSEYLLLDIERPEAALEWLGCALEQVRSVDELGRKDEAAAAATADAADGAGKTRKAGSPKHSEAWSIGFSYRGLVQLRAMQDEDAPFPSDFRNGQASPVRRRLLREDPVRDPWQWGDVPVQPAADERTEARRAVSMLVARFHDGSDPAEHELLREDHLSRMGLRLVRRIQGSAGNFRTEQVDGRQVTRLQEPFGFADGIAQPALRGLGHYRQAGDLSAEPRRYEQDREVPLGEFVLGHLNAFDEPAHCPGLMLREPGRGTPFGRNGSYLVLRQIRQNVAAFRKFEAHCDERFGFDDGASLSEKMIGRRKDGTPLQSCPAAPGSMDGFRYRLDDSQGFQCPVGAHVRRSNPRDSLADNSASGIASSKTRRLLRRGRPYASCGCVESGRAMEACATPEQCPEAEVGMVFIALVADLARQYEFVQRVWVGNPSFGGLQKANDPLLGGSAGDWKFSLPGQPTGTRVQMPSLAGFTRTLGGGYFFLPGLSALRQLANSEFIPSDRA